jgi:hypothetical protein
MEQKASLKHTAAVLLPALREVRRRRKPDGVCFELPVTSADGVRLDCRLIGGDPRDVRRWLERTL